ncbi:hypothetical protein IQ06DRAFT_291417 [Phaeosphaeriaceae sp. SRC1lsM3a]|nr:hypothetical protein IQ06DRAFT_291417 [Stagonospora sp. SRC1lsM3a]
MPYNNTPIEPSKEITGHVSLPLARVQKIIHADPERLNVSKNAAFAIALATEMFIQHLATTTHNVVKTERKPRRNIQYRDVSSAVAKTDNLEFAVDVVPRTIIFKEAKKRREEKEEREKVGDAEGGKGKGKAGVVEVANGNANGNGAVDADIDVNDDTEIVETEQVAPTQVQVPDPALAPASAPAKTEAPAPANDAMDVDERVEDSDPEEDPAAMQLEMEMRGPPRQKTQSPEQPKATMATRRSTGGFTAINGAK